jgi:hypothetical protein
MKHQLASIRQKRLDHLPEPLFLLLALFFGHLYRIPVGGVARILRFGFNVVRSESNHAGAPEI